MWARTHGTHLTALATMLGSLVAHVACSSQSKAPDDDSTPAGHSGGGTAGTTAGRGGSSAQGGTGAAGGSGTSGQHTSGGTSGVGGSSASAGSAGATSAGAGGGTAGGADAGQGGQGGESATNGRGSVEPTSGCRFEHVAAPHGALGFTAADFDEDGTLDLAIWDYTLFPPAQYAVVWGSEGGFSAPSYTMVEVMSQYVDHGDFNGDSHEDIVVAGSRSGGTNNEYGALVLSGNGTRQVGPVESGGYTKYAIGSAVGDFDGDGLLDLFAVHDDELGICAGLGDGTFADYAGKYPITSPSYAPGGDGPVGAVGDFDENGTLDLAVPTYVINSPSSGDLVVLLLDESGAFTRSETKYFDVGVPLVADFDGDEHLDLAALSDGRFMVWLGDGAGHFELVTGLSPTLGDAPEYSATGDLDGDEIPDLVTYNYDSEDFSVLFGNGDGTFAAERRVKPRLGGAFGLQVADIDGDGRDDFLQGALDGVDIYYGPCPRP